MFRRVSISVLLTSVVLALSAAIVVLLSLSAWDSWRRLATAERIAGVIEAEAGFFTALHNLRVDRSSTNRDLSADKQFAAMSESMRVAREAEMPALRAGLAAMSKVSFAQRQAAIESLESSIKKLTALQQESAAALLQPKSARRATLAREYFDETGALLEFLGKLSAQL